MLSIAQSLLPAAVTVLAFLPALVPSSTLASTRSIAQHSAIAVWAVSLPAIIADAHHKRLAAPETHDLVDLDRVVARHALARRASTTAIESGNLYTSRRRAFRLAASTCPAARA
jgi:hypothetical protein